MGNKRLKVVIYCCAMVLIFLPGLIGVSPVKASGDSAVIYVDINATGDADGTSWEDAYTNLGYALSLAASREVWVAQGTYRPPDPPFNGTTYTIPSSAMIYGGFEGNESSRDERDWAAHPTILSGNSVYGNTRHVVTANSGGTLDGFTIRDGYANLIDAGADGAGLTCFSSPAFIYLNHIVFNNNDALHEGGAIYGYACNFWMKDVSFFDNSAYDGGGIYAYNSTVYLYSGTLFNNIANHEGEGVYGSGTVIIKNTIIRRDASSQVKNMGTLRVSYSDIQGCGTSSVDWVTACGTDDGGNIDIDPFFKDTAVDDLHLTRQSPVIDVGNNSGVSTYDLDGNPRISHGTVDIGAFEFDLRGLMVDDTAPGPDHDGLSWTSAFLNLDDALTVTRTTDEIWVAEGVYRPGTGQTDTFDLVSGVELYGGFDGTETMRSQRDWKSHVTVLSGDVDQNDNTNAYGFVTDPDDILGTNAYHVVSGIDLTDNSILDGFTITGGDGSSGPYTGAGIHLEGGSPMLRNIIFTGNQSYRGAGLSVYNSSPKVINGLFFGNATGPDSGGAIYYTMSATGVLVNSTIWNNQGCGIALYGNSTPGIINSILWGNETACTTGLPIVDALTNPLKVSYSDVQGCGGSDLWLPACGVDEGGNIDSNPLFVDPSDLDLHLGIGSPAIDTGLSSLVTLYGITTDLDGLSRIVNGTIDLGTFEWRPQFYLPAIIKAP